MQRPKPRALLPLISIITFPGFLDTTLLIPIMALYASGLGASVGITGLIIGLYSVTNTPFIVPIASSPGFNSSIDILEATINLLSYHHCATIFSEG